MAVGVDLDRDAVGVDRLSEDGEVAGGVLVGPEAAGGDDPGRVVDRPDQGELRARPAEPAVSAAVELEEPAGLTDPFAPAPVAGWSTAPDRGDAGLVEDPPQGPLRDGDPFALREEIGEVGPVDPGVRRRRQLDERRPEPFGRAMNRPTSAVAVGEPGRSFTPERRDEPPDLADRQLEQPRGGTDVESPVEDLGDDIEAVLRPRVQRDRLPRLHEIESDKVTGRLRGDSFTGRSHDFGGPLDFGA